MASRQALYIRLNAYREWIIAKGGEEEDYRLILQRFGAGAKGGKISASTMTTAAMEQVLAEAKTKGFRPPLGKRKKGQPPRRQPATRKATHHITDAQIAKIRALWCALAALQEEIGIEGVRDQSEEALRGWLARQIGHVNPVAVEHLPSARAGEIIEMLKRWGQRIIVERWEQIPSGRHSRAVELIDESFGASELTASLLSAGRPADARAAHGRDLHDAATRASLHRQRGGDKRIDRAMRRTRS